MFFFFNLFNLVNIGVNVGRYCLIEEGEWSFCIDFLLYFGKFFDKILLFWDLLWGVFVFYNFFVFKFFNVLWNFLLFFLK